MGNSDSAPTNDMSQFDGCETLGYRILGVQPNSPASRAGLVSFFDFLVGANGQLIFGVDDGTGNEYFVDVDFPALLKGSVDQEVELLVWNIKNKTQRFLTLTPSTSWGGKGLLGVTIRMDDYATAEENLLRVLSVEKDSPAALAGLTPQTDYLLGTTMESFENEDVLADVLETSEDNVVEMYVYNTQSDVVRVITLIPSLKWGGRGLLGAEVGRGYLHRLPKDCGETLGVSFERKVRISDDSVTSSCGAVDLKLDEVDMLENQRENDNIASVPNQTATQIIQSEDYNSNKDSNYHTSESATESLVPDPAPTPTPSGATETNNVDLSEAEVPTKHDDDILPPVPSLPKFPSSTPQLYNDSGLIGMSEKNDDLPPPPISTMVDHDHDVADGMSSVDLR